ncbi:hypothetical protein Y032_0001g323 [Ancylostoma ceylanicum]|uniref:Secreted protein n=1 Tax=Ancylostoma ceylanicum TaxID=53326 RepID=A0A016W4L9_9BILA|nr:hypothetical protein Y032_0001g323 [Ancylostoma ceylanicum]
MQFFSSQHAIFALISLLLKPLVERTVTPLFRRLIAGAGRVPLVYCCGCCQLKQAVNYCAVVSATEQSSLLMFWS